jgi:hypothetical protein
MPLVMSVSSGLFRNVIDVTRLEPTAASSSLSAIAHYKNLMQKPTMPISIGLGLSSSSLAIACSQRLIHTTEEGEPMT